MMRAFALLAATVLLAAPAAAKDSFYAAFIAARNGVAPCYARSYDQKHIAEHPRQKVVHFFVTGTDWPDMAPPKTFAVDFGFRLKGSDDSFASAASCVAKGDGAACSAEGDGGHFRLTPREDGLLVTVVERLEVEGMESFSPNLMDSDDRELRLYKGEAGECVYDAGGAGDGGEAEPEGDPNAPALSRPG